MLDGPIPPDHHSVQKSQKKHKTNPPPFKGPSGDNDSEGKSDSTPTGKMHKFGPMEFTDKEWRKFMDTLARNLSRQMKHDQDRAKKMNERLKRVAEGKPMYD